MRQGEATLGIIGKATLVVSIIVVFISGFYGMPDSPLLSMAVLASAIAIQGFPTRMYDAREFASAAIALALGYILLALVGMVVGRLVQ